MNFNEDILRAHADWRASWQIIEKLQNSGFEAVLAGGCVRDAFLGRVPKDLDIATSADPNKVEELFRKTVAVGKAFGVIRVLDFKTEAQNEGLEVASFRFDGSYEDGRRPTSVTWASAAVDAERRDFTANALFYDPVGKKVHDFVGGIEDIRARRLRCVGDPQRRFREDHLRLLRAVRFTAELDFEMAAQTESALAQMSTLVADVSPERVRDEIYKMLGSKNANLALRMLKKYQLLAQVDPELDRAWTEDLVFANQYQAAKNNLELWASFFALTSELALKPRLARYKLSKETQNFVTQALRFFYQPAAIALWPLAKKLAEYESEEMKFALKLIEQRLGPQAWISGLRTEVRNRGLDQKFPEPLLKGSDIPEIVPPEKRGQWLKQAYEIQLEQSCTDKTTLLATLLKLNGEKLS